MRLTVMPNSATREHIRRERNRISREQLKGQRRSPRQAYELKPTSYWPEPIDGSFPDPRLIPERL